MAYTSSPQISTYKTERYNFAGNLQQVDGTSLKNQRTVNMIPELNYVSLTQDKDYFLKKRSGLKLRDTKTANVARGIYNWQGKIVEVLGNTVYVDNANVGTVTVGAGSVGFCPYYGQTFGQALIMLDGTAGWILKPDNSFIQITDTGFPNPHIPTPVCIDEYVIVSKAGTQDFYQSNLDDPTVWTAGDFNTAEMFPDITVALAQFKNYIVVCGTQSIEFFYDSGNPDGSSFSRSEAVIQQVGVHVPATLQVTEDVIIFVGDTGRGGLSVWTIEKFKDIDICNEQVRMALDAEGNSVNFATSVVVRTNGHHLYILNLTNRSFAYDFDLKIWHEWSYDGGAFAFPYSTNNTNSNPVLQHASNGNSYELDQFTYVDDVVPITCIIQTDEINFKSYNRKSWNRLTIANETLTAEDSFLTVQWTDDNFDTISAGRLLNLSAVPPSIQKMGMGRNRTYKFTYTDNKPLRVEYYELDVNVMSR